MIELNYSNMMYEVIGRMGLYEGHIVALREKIIKAHDYFVHKKWPGIAFMDLPSQDTREIKETGKWVRERFSDFLILGIGGSALGPRAILEALSPFHNLLRKPRVFIYDNVDPRTLRHILSLLNLKKTAVNVITKSGSTAETMASFMVLWEELSKAVKNASERFIATTDPYTGNLKTIAIKKSFRTLSIPRDVVGRYSVLSPVGLLLAEVIGIDSREMLEGARDIQIRCSEPDVWKNPAYLFGSLIYLMESKEKRNINVIMPYADSLKALSEWFCQLWAESLGKFRVGITPYPSLGTVDQHSQLQLWMDGPDDKVVIFLRIEDYGTDIRIPAVFEDIEGISYLGGHLFSELIKAEEESTELALAKNSRPNMTIKVPSIDPYHMGQLFYFFEVATVFTCLLYGVNPFNQPGVEEGKRYTYGMMGKKGFEDKRDEVIKARQQKDRFRL